MTVTPVPDRAWQLSSIRPSLLRAAAIGGLLGGLVLFAIMASYNAANDMGFWAILNSCFAAFVYKSARMAPMHEPAMPGHAMSMGSEPIVTSHVVVGGLLHLAMSIGAGAAFAVALTLLIRAGLRQLANPLLYVLGGAAGGALLYLIMMEAVAPNLNRTIVDFTPRVPFFFAHLAFGATVAAYVYWRTATARKHVAVTAGGRFAAA
jgi:hypothetical protein